jgi:acyl carrier protein
MIKEENILEIIKDLEIDVDISSISISLPLSEQGLDSLDLSTILFELEDRYFVKITDEDIESGKLESIDKILKFIQENG